MVSTEHQQLVNALARVLDQQKGITIETIDIGGTPELFDQKYRGLPAPHSYEGSIPDLEGRDTNGTICLGEAETDMGAENLNKQLKTFSGCTMNQTGASVPLHVIVPRHIRQAMEYRIRSLGLGHMLDDGRVTVWA